MTKQTQIISENFTVIDLNNDLNNKLPPPSGNFGASSVCNYYQNLLDFLPSKFNFSNVTENLVLKLLKDMNIDKAAGIDNVVLAKPI